MKRIHKVIKILKKQGVVAVVKKTLKVLYDTLRKTPLSIKALSNKTIIVSYSDDIRNVKNFGDALNPCLVSALSGKKVISFNKITNFSHKTVYSVIGSVLDKKNIENMEVWGSGFISKDGKFNISPKKIHAVRGPLTRELVLKQGLDCPEVYGDPALLLPLIYQPKGLKQYKVGIIPHYVDKDNEYIKRFKDKVNHDAIIIDIEDDIFSIAEKINQCEFIASSSLHGIIVADAYGIPSMWIKCSDHIRGGNFKYLDYFMSVNRKHHQPYVINHDFSLEDLIENHPHEKVVINTDKLLRSCPFYKQ
jgi:pyruvyltransferase